MGKKRSGLVVLILSPSFKRVIVALVAIEPDAQEEVRGVFHHRGRVAQDLVIVGGRVLFGASGGDQNRLHELVVGDVFLNLIANPGPECDGAFRGEELAIDLQKVGPFVGPVVHERLAADQLVDCSRSFFTGRFCVGQEGFDFVGGRWKAGQIKIHAAEEGGIIGQP